MLDGSQGVSLIETGGCLRLYAVRAAGPGGSARAFPERQRERFVTRDKVWDSREMTVWHDQWRPFNPIH